MADTAGRTTTKTPPTPQKIRKPRDFAETCEEVAMLRTLMRRYEDLERKRDARIANLKKRLDAEKEATDPELDLLIHEVTARAKNAYDYVHTHRTELTGNGKLKKVQFSLDNVGRWSSSTFVKVPDEDAAIKEIQKKKMSHLLRTTHALDKEAIRKHPSDAAKLETVHLSDRERFRFALHELTRVVEAVVSDPQPEWSIVKPPEPRKK